MEKVVGIGEYAVSNNPEDTIVTYALSSCIAVTAHSPIKKAVGMVHILLPYPCQSQEHRLGPCYYAATGIPLMINKMCSEYGCLKDELKIRLYGGADSIRGNDIFRLGQKNIRAVTKVLIGMNLAFDASGTGGVLSRTLEMDAATGGITVKSQHMAI